MKTGFLFLMMSLCLVTISSAQKSDQKPNKPNEKSTVKREYDDKGNLIKFDSTYTYSWSGDTTLNKSFSPKDLESFFSEHFGNQADSSFFGNPFPDGIEQFFSHSFSGKQDSLLLKKFGIHPDLHNFGFKNDSLAMNLKDFDGFFNPFSENKNDSVSPKSSGKSPQASQPKSMDDLMKMLRQHMQEMEKNQQEFFNDQKKWQGL